MKTFFEFMTEQSFSDLVASNPRFSKSMKSFVNNNKITSDIQAREPAEPPTKFKPPEKLEPVDFTGSRYGDEGIVTDQDKVTRQNQNQARKGYQQPPGYDTPAFNKAKQKMAAADARPGEPPMPGAGPYKTKQADPLNTPRAVPVKSIKPPMPKAKPKDLVPNKQGADQKIPRPKLRPERKPEITNTDNTKGPVAIPKPDSVGMNVKPSKKAPETFKQIFARTPEGKKFTWTDPQTGKTGTYIRKTKKKTKKR